MSAVEDRWGAAGAAYLADLRRQSENPTLVEAVEAVERSAHDHGSATPDSWVGSVGDRVTVTGTITVARTWAAVSRNNTTRSLYLDTPDGAVEMDTAAAWANRVGRGDVVTVTGVVKAHRVDGEGRRQTVLSRPKRIEDKS